MTVKLLIDVNLSPKWVPVLRGLGWSAIHWSEIGDPRATDDAIMAWARQNGHTVFTHDLDFGALLALSGASGPSVLQVRSQDVLPDRLADVVATALRQHGADLASGALVVVDRSRARVRVLPIQTPDA